MPYDNQGNLIEEPAGGGMGRLFADLVHRGRNGARSEQQGRMDGFKTLLTQAQALGEQQNARRTYQENQGLDNLEGTLIPLLGPQMAAAVAASARGKYDLHQGTQAAGDVQTQGFRTDARDALARGDYIGGNANLAAIDGKPLQISNESGGVVLNPYALPGAPMVTTAVGQADIGAKHAQAAASMASAADNYASAGEHKARTVNIKDGGDGNGKVPGFNYDANNLRVLESPQLDSHGQPITNPLTGAPQMQVDPKRMGTFFAFAQGYRKTHPKATADEAMASFLAGGEERAHANEAQANLAVQEARALIQAGKISRQEAQQRLIRAGYPSAAQGL